jgi:hypothetical protein
MQIEFQFALHVLHFTSSENEDKDEQDAGRFGLGASMRRHHPSS